MLMSTSVRNFIDREQGKEIEGEWIEYCWPGYSRVRPLNI